MAIFNSYVSLPECNDVMEHDSENILKPASVFKNFQRTPYVFHDFRNSPAWKESPADF